MKALQNLSIKNKVISVILLVNIFSIVIGFSIVIYQSVESFKEEMANNIRMSSRVISEYAQIAISFEDSIRAKDILKEFSTIPTVEYAQINHPVGKYFASYNRHNQLHSVPRIEKNISQHFFDDKFLHSFELIIKNNKELGILYVKTSKSELREKINHFIWSILGLVVFITALVFFLAQFFQKIISKPILKLADVTQKNSEEADYSVRVQKQNNDEIGKLYDNFNHMLIEIQHHETALQESEEKFKKMSESAFDAMILLNEKGHVYFWNIAAEKIFGYAKKDIVDKDFHCLFPSSRELEIFFMQIENLKDKIPEGKSLETIALHKTGKEFSVEISAGVLNIKNKWNVVCIVKDITERKHNELALRKAKDEAEESDRLKSAFLANMSHEIRTPMNSIIGFSELLKSPNVSFEKRNKYLDIVSSNGKMLLNLIDDIIDISKIEAGQLKIRYVECNINAVLTELFSSFDERRKKGGYEFDLRLKKGSPDMNFSIRTDPFRFRQIFANLLGNAYKFTEEGFIEFGYSIKENNILQFYVRDTGIGIPQDKLKIIFERFGQVDDSYTKNTRGAGLGLSITQRLVELLGGEISVDSKVGMGSIFYFTLPYEKIFVPVKEIPSQIPEPKIDWSEKTILIAEDEEDNFMLLEELLSDTKAHILHATTGKEAVEIVKKTQIHLVLMDINMPEMDGYEATRLIKKMNKNIPVVAQTAYAMSGEREKSSQAGCDNYITKPININELLSTISKFFQ